jgi:hypothetical protein
VAGQLYRPQPVLVRVAAAIRDHDAPVAACLQAAHDASRELSIRHATVDAIVPARLLYRLETIEATKVGLDEHERARLTARHHRLAETLTERLRVITGEHRDRRPIRLQPRDVPFPKLRAVHLVQAGGCHRSPPVGGRACVRHRVGLGAR